VDIKNSKKYDDEDIDAKLGRPKYDDNKDLFDDDTNVVNDQIDKKDDKRSVSTGASEIIDDDF
jgi:hypothetical protein